MRRRILIDLVDAQPMRPSALVGDAPNLLNVSLSRARGKLVLVADVAYFETVDPGGLVARLLRAAVGGHSFDNATPPAGP